MAATSSVSPPPTAPEPIRALEPRFYTDPTLFEREREAVFFRTWQFAGHVSQLGRTGDFFTFEISDQALFCVRGRDDVIRAFYNVCAHRGHALVSGEGHCSVVVCPYHAWSYELDGRLRKANNQKRAMGFDANDVRLSEVRVEVFCGFIFVNLDPDAAPMEDWYPNVESELWAFVPWIDDLNPVQWIEIEEACNWKVTVEN